MPLWTTEDLAVFFEDDIDDAAFSHAGGAASNIKVNFTNEYLSVKFSGGMEVESFSLAAICKSSDVASAVNDDILTINNVAYKVFGPPQPDGTGMTILVLSRD